MKKQVCPLSGVPCDLRKCYHISEIVDNKEVDCLSLCNGCANDYLEYKNNPKAFEAKMIETSEQLLDNLFGKIVIPPPCSKCGITAQTVMETGKLGCSECYKNFKGELLLVLKDYHNNVKHIGKKPKSLQKESLKEQLKKAIETENYEEASRIKKLIQ